MKLLAIALVFCISYLQYAKNFDAQGGPRLDRLILATEKAKLKKKEIARENQRLGREIRDLIGGYTVIEELARSKMGMIKHGEVLFRVYPTKAKKSN